MVATVIPIVNDQMGLSIFACLCCCWPIGIFAIMKSSEVRDGPCFKWEFENSIVDFVAEQNYSAITENVDISLKFPLSVIRSRLEFRN
jgi:hypothetical protein